MLQITSVDGDAYTCTIAEFLQDNEDMEYVAEIPVGTTIVDGGGAAPEFTVTRLTL